MATALVNTRQPLPRNPRVATAWHPALRAKLEYLDQPLYDSVSFDGLSLALAQTFFFNAGLGATENNGSAAAAGIRAVNKSLLNTNLLVPSVLSNPKLFIVTGIGITWQQFISDTRPEFLGNAFATTMLESDDERDIRNYSYQTWLQFGIGNKSYLNCPLWQAPNTYGVGGSALASDNDLAAAPQSPIGFALTGRPYTMDDMQLLIPPQQTFGVTFNVDAGTAAGMGAAALWTFLQDERCWVTLWGVLGREVQ